MIVATVSCGDIVVSIVKSVAVERDPVNKSFPESWSLMFLDAATKHVCFVPAKGEHHAMCLLAAHINADMTTGGVAKSHEECMAYFNEQLNEEEIRCFFP